MEEYAALLASCEQNGVDTGIVAFVGLDTCGSKSPIRNCGPGSHLFHEVVADALKIDVVNKTELARGLRDAVRADLWSVAGVRRSMQAALARVGTRPCQGDRYFLHDVVGSRCVGTDVYRDKALTSLRMSYEKGAAGWQGVQFPIVFHLQWTADLTKTGKAKMLFHVTFEPWKTAVGLALALCRPQPPIQVRETPYKDTQSLHEFQPPRKYVVDWDMYVRETLGECAPADALTEDFLFDMFVRALSVMHAYMREAHVLPADKRLCVSIKSRTRACKNKQGDDDTKCSFHATVHIMEPAERHRLVICKVLDMVKKRTPLAIEVMNKRTKLTSAKMLAELGDSAGFIAMDTAMTKNWHQPLQCIGSSKGDGIIFRHKALVTFALDAGCPPDVAVARTEEERFPRSSPLDMALLVAQHSASIPDPYSITYAVTSKWSRDHFHSGNDGLAALRHILGGGGSHKRKFAESSQCTTPRSSCSSASTAAVPVQHDVREALAKLGSGQMKAVHDFKSRPDHAKGVGAQTGQVLSLRGYPCVVQALLHSKAHVHKTNCMYLWTPAAVGAADSYLLCLDPECRQKARRHWDTCGDAGTLPRLDSAGWGSLRQCVAHLACSGHK